MTEKLTQANHREWLNMMKGEKSPEQDRAKAMPGLESIPIDSLVIDDGIGDEVWTNIKQNIIPLKPKADDEQGTKATRQLRTMRAQLNSQEAFLALVQDAQIGEQDGHWVLGIINPRELTLPEDRLRGGMESSYMVSDLVGGSSSRAALLAVTGSDTI